MRQVFAWFVRAMYRFSFPIWGVYLHNSERTRVIVLCGDQVLLLRGWIGDQQWGFPGGGVGRKEDPRHAAARELYEEVGIRIAPERLNLTGVDRLPHHRMWPSYAVRFYQVTLNKKNTPRIIRPYEIMEAKWLPLSNLPKNTSESVHIGLKGAILNAPK